MSMTPAALAGLPITAMNENHCVICWEIIPEGRLVCPTCEKQTMGKADESETKGTKQPPDKKT